MKVIDICDEEDITFAKAQQALANLQMKGQITGFIPGDPEADILLTGMGVLYMKETGELN